MDNQSFNRVRDQSFRYSFKLSLILCIVFILAGLTTSSVFGQKATWRYVMTSLSGTKTYLNDERKTLPGKNLGAWEKMVGADGSSVVTLVEWDCAGKSRLIHQTTYFNSRQSAVGGKSKGFEWSRVIPGSAGDFLYHRLCLTAMPPKLVQIIADHTPLRARPDDAASTTRIAHRNEQFQIVPESGLGGWFNLVDPATQEDYWLEGKSFKIIDAAPASTTTSSPKAGVGSVQGKPSKSSRRVRRPKSRVKQNR